MEWRESNSILISKKRYGENSWLLKVFSCTHGLYSGLYRIGRRLGIAPMEMGDLLDVSWRARLDNHLGSFSIHSIKSVSVFCMRDVYKLYILQSMGCLLNILLPERLQEKEVYNACCAIICAMRENSFIRKRYINFEKQLLCMIGVRLNLDKCAVRGVRENLSFISPRSGRAVSQEAAIGYENKLLPYCHILKHDQDIEVDNKDFVNALRVTRYFIAKQMLHMNIDIPEYRVKLEEMFL